MSKNKINKAVLISVLFLLFFSIGSVAYRSSFVSSSSDVICGDASGDGKVNVSDAVYIINYVFVGGPAPVHFGVGDVDDSASVNVSDAVYLINYVFNGGPEPNCPFVQPIIIDPVDDQIVGNPIYVAVENHGIADPSEVQAVKIYYAVDDINWVYLATVGSSSENLWEFSIDLNLGFNYIMVIMESGQIGRSSPSVLIEVVWFIASILISFVLFLVHAKTIFRYCNSCSKKSRKNN